MLWALLLFSGAATFYYGAVVSGLYKDPLMARFRRYGENEPPSPLVRFLNAAGGCCLALALLMPVLAAPHSYVYRVFGPLVFVVLALIAFGGGALVGKQPALRHALPRWYFELLRTASRQERRQIAYAWLRLPRRLRWRLNGDQASFRVWADMVRLTVIYGAYDPNSPWDIWT